LKMNDNSKIPNLKEKEKKILYSVISIWAIGSLSYIVLKMI
jgi:hypothetical protein